MMKTFTHERPSVTDPQRTEPVEVDDAAAYIAKFKSGATGVIESSRNSIGNPDRLCIEIGLNSGRTLNCRPNPPPGT